MPAQSDLQPPASSPFSPLPFSKLDARAWVVWVLVTAVLTMMARNPLYTLLLLLAALAAQRPQSSGLKLPLLWLGSIIILFSAAFNLLWIHAGELVLFRLPAQWPLVGGAYTLEAAAYGIINGLLLFTLLALFQAFGGNVSSSDLVRLMPGALRDLGVVVLIAITYVPETHRQLQRIQQAQAIRGHRLRGWRDWRPVAIPLLISGMERALAVAEAMVARGYGATNDSAQRIPVQVGLLLSLTAVCGGWLLALWQQTLGWLLIGAGGAGIVALFVLLGHRNPRTRYQPRSWHWRDSLVVGTAVLALLIALLPAIRPSLSYSPFPTLALPPFHPLMGMALALLSIPGLFNNE